MAEKKTDVWSVLLEAQARIGGLAKDALNPHFRKAYLTLDALLAAAGPACEDAGGVFWWTMKVLEDHSLMVSLHFRSVHSPDGEEIISEMRIDETGPQKIGAALTYFKRYMLGSLMRVRTEEDDDGNRAQSYVEKKSDEKPKQREVQF